MDASPGPLCHNHFAMMAIEHLPYHCKGPLTIFRRARAPSSALHQFTNLARAYPCRSRWGPWFLPPALPTIHHRLIGPKVDFAAAGPALAAAIAARLLLNPMLIVLVADVLTEAPSIILALSALLCLLNSARARTTGVNI